MSERSETNSAAPRRRLRPRPNPEDSIFATGAATRQNRGRQATETPRTHATRSQGPVSLVPAPQTPIATHRVRQIPIITVTPPAEATFTPSRSAPASIISSSVTESPIRPIRTPLTAANTFSVVRLSDVPSPSSRTKKAAKPGYTKHFRPQAFPRGHWAKSILKAGQSLPPVVPPFYLDGTPIPTKGSSVHGKRTHLGHDPKDEDVQFYQEDLYPRFDALVTAKNTVRFAADRHLLITPVSLLPNPAQVQAPVAGPITTVVPVVAPVVAPVPAPVTTPVVVPAAIPVIAPVAAPITAPVVAPIITPAAAPIITPVAAPIIIPIVTPVTAPVSAPAAAPVVISNTAVTSVTPAATTSVTPPAATPVVAVTSGESKPRSILRPFSSFKDTKPKPKAVIFASPVAQSHSFKQGQPPKKVKKNDPPRPQNSPSFDQLLALQSSQQSSQVTTSSSSQAPSQVPSQVPSQASTQPPPQVVARPATINDIISGFATTSVTDPAIIRERLIRAEQKQVEQKKFEKEVALQRQELEKQRQLQLEEQQQREAVEAAARAAEKEVARQERIRLAEAQAAANAQAVARKQEEEEATRQKELRVQELLHQIRLRGQERREEESREKEAITAIYKKFQERLQYQVLLREAACRKAAEEAAARQAAIDQEQQENQRKYDERLAIERARKDAAFQEAVDRIAWDRALYQNTLTYEARRLQQEAYDQAVAAQLRAERLHKYEVEKAQELAEKQRADYIQKLNAEEYYRQKEIKDELRRQEEAAIQAEQEAKALAVQQAADLLKSKLQEKASDPKEKVSTVKRFVYKTPPYSYWDHKYSTKGKLPEPYKKRKRAEDDDGIPEWQRIWPKGRQRSVLNSESPDRFKRNIETKNTVVQPVVSSPATVDQVTVVQPIATSTSSSPKKIVKSANAGKPLKSILKNSNTSKYNNNLKRSHQDYLGNEPDVLQQISLPSSKRRKEQIQIRITRTEAFIHARAKLGLKQNAQALVAASKRRIQQAARTYKKSKRAVASATTATMMSAKRLCLNSITSLYTRAEQVQQVIFGNGQGNTPLPNEQSPGESTASTADPLVSTTQATTLSTTNKTKDHLTGDNHIEASDDSDSFDEAEWYDNPNLNAPYRLPAKSEDGSTQASATYNNQEVQDLSGEESSVSLSERIKLRRKNSSQEGLAKNLEWLGLDDEHKTSVALKISAKREQLRVHEKAERERKAQEEKERLKRQKKIEEERLGRVEPPVGHDLFGELSEQLEERVEAAFNAPAHRQMSATVEGTELLAAHFQTLSARQWLNDEIINGAMGLYVDHAQKHFEDKRSATPTVQAMTTHFFSQMETKGDGTVAGTHGTVKRWATRKKVGGAALLKCKLLLVPINEGNNHWTLLAVWPEKKVVEYYDSFHSSPQRIFRTTKLFLEGELGDLYKESEWSYRTGKSPRQANGYDCGVFTCTTAKMLMLGYEPEIAYTGEHMASQRKRIAAELLSVGLEGELKPAFAEGWLR